jgi:hypothetical protein
MIFRVFIHEYADAEATQQFWLDVTQADAAQFRRPTLKRHNPKTVRKNTGGDYHGCLRIDVLRSSILYRRIEAGPRPPCPQVRWHLSTPAMIRTRLPCSRARIRTSVRDTKRPRPAG